jgi:hypothetical protein
MGGRAALSSKERRPSGTHCCVHRDSSLLCMVIYPSANGGIAALDRNRDAILDRTCVHRLTSSDLIKPVAECPCSSQSPASSASVGAYLHLIFHASLPLPLPMRLVRSPSPSFLVFFCARMLLSTVLLLCSSSFYRSLPFPSHIHMFLWSFLSTYTAFRGSLDRVSADPRRQR